MDGANFGPEVMGWTEPKPERIGFGDPRVETQRLKKRSLVGDIQIELTVKPTIKNAEVQAPNLAIR